MCLFVDSEFLEFHRRLRKPSYIFMGSHRWIHMYDKKYRGFHSRGYLYLLAITQHIFLFLFIQSCDPVGCCPIVPSTPNQTLNTVLIIIMHSHLFNVMSSCICNAMRHCMLYHVTCIMNATWTMLKLYTSPCTMDNYINHHKICKRSHISCQYICTHIYQHQQAITNQAMTYFIL